ncbi:MAG TPA: isoprenylcysteine carboxylmethyltransferase family protein [Candidatus Omnitrophota bacterium]|nr:isoprenylcysteine carboxylmethyltransferase family protein [Candidatus Omnitrophota bacterium]
MALRETYEKQGAFLFRWRSYIPLLLIPIVFIALRDPSYSAPSFEGSLGRCWDAFAILVSLSGLIVRAMVAGYVPRGTSGRNTLTQVAESLNTKGMYSIVRNPLYLGNFLMIFGIFLFLQVWWFVILGSLLFWVYYERIIFTEEEFLRKKFGEPYVAWSNKTPVFIPNFKTWQKSDLPFSWKTVLRREHSSFFGMVAVFTVLGLISDLFIERCGISLFWLIFFGGGLLIYSVLRFLKKKTHLLDMEGR